MLKKKKKKSLPRFYSSPEFLGLPTCGFTVWMCVFKNIPIYRASHKSVQEEPFSPLTGLILKAEELT